MTKEPLGTLRIGASSWSFPDWRGVFYPPRTPADRQLSYYASQFNSVEINTSFYALPEPRILLRWLESVPAAFTFSLKAPREISHEKRLVDVERIAAAYLDVVRSLGASAAPGLLQFPPTVTRSRAGRRLADFVDRLATVSAEIPLSVEVRAPDLMTSAFARFLMERQISFVVVERAGQPDTFACWQAAADIVERTPARKGDKVESAPARKGNEADTRLPLHIRLIGRDRDPLPDDKIIRRPQDELLDRWARRIADTLYAGRDVFCYVHNPFEGHAPETVRRLRARVGELLPLPEWNPEIARPAGEVVACAPARKGRDEDEGGQLALF